MPTRLRSHSHPAPRRANVIGAVRGAVGWALSSARSGCRKAGSVAHRVRYLSLAIAAFGALLAAVGPRPLPSHGDALGDNSMAPGFVAGQPLNVNRRAFVASSPHVGEIVVFYPPVGEHCARRPPRGSACLFTARVHEAGEGIKRIVAGPGDRVALINGRLLRNGRIVRESYNRWPCVIASICNLPRQVTLSPGTWWLLADNRDAPNDSRSYGPIPTAWIIGLVSARAADHSTAAPPPGSGVSCVGRQDGKAFTKPKRKRACDGLAGDYGRGLGQKRRGSLGASWAVSWR
jgi:signal peptidase I